MTDLHVVPAELTPPRTPARRHLRVGPPVDLCHVIGEVEQPPQRVWPHLGDRPEVLHEITTPAAVAVTRSSAEVGRFLPTKSGRIGSSRWPRSTSTASCTEPGRP